MKYLKLTVSKYRKVTFSFKRTNNEIMPHNGNKGSTKFNMFVVCLTSDKWCKSYKCISHGNKKMKTSQKLRNGWLHVLSSCPISEESKASPGMDWEKWS